MSLGIASGMTAIPRTPQAASQKSMQPAFKSSLGKTLTKAGTELEKAGKRALGDAMEDPNPVMGLAKTVAASQPGWTGATIKNIGKTLENLNL